MKKIFFLLILAGTSYFSVAQQVYVQGGVNLANITSNDEGHTEDNNTLTTFNAGVLGRFTLGGPVGLETGLLLSGHGSKSETNFPSTGADVITKVTSEFKPWYVQLPLNLVFSLPKTSGPAFFIHAGPYAAVGVGGKASVTTTGGIAGTTHYEKDIEFSNDDPFTSEHEDAAYDRLKRFDYGLNLGGGLNLKKMIIKANYGMGLAKINSTESDNSAGDKNKYRTLSLSLGLTL